MKKCIQNTNLGSRTWRNIALVLIALFSVVQAQVVVQVPTFCSVVVPGVGGNISLGLVGDGGTVVMPDPFDYSSLNFVATLNSPAPPNDYTLSSWTVKGDLSFQTSSGIIQTFGSNLVANIESFNENVRTSESTSPSSGTLARSKGRVLVNCAYASPQCAGGFSISFDVYKMYSNSTYLPPIIGPSCWTPNTTVTYSVDPIASDNLMDAIGTDTYFWEVKDANNNTLNSFYGSADNSSITFTTPSNSSGQWTVSCGYGFANPWVSSPSFANRTTIVTKSINSPVPTPTFSTAPPTCLNTGTTSFTATVNAQTGMSYAWSYVGSGSPTVTASGTSNSTVTVSGMDDNPGILTLSVTNTLGFCPAVQTFQYTVNRNFVTPMALTLSSNTGCLSPGNTFQVSLPASAMNNPTSWTLPSGWSKVNNNSSGSSVTVTVGASALAGTNTITAFSTACSTGTISATVNVQPTPVLSGPTCINVGSTSALTYTVSAPSNSSLTYAWTLPTGWSGSSTTNSITVTPNGSSIGNVSVSVCAGSCCNSTSLAVNFNPQAPSILPPKCYNVGMAGVATFSIQNPASSGTYNWTVDASFGTATNFTGNSFVVNTYGTPGNYPQAVTVTYTNVCGTSVSSSVPVNLAYNGTLTLQSNPGMDILMMTGFNSPGGFKWVQDCGLITESLCASCGSAPQVNLTNIATGGSWGAITPDFFGCFSKQCTTTTYGNRVGQNSGSGAEGHGNIDKEVTLSPNPNGGEFEIRIERVKTNAEYVVVDAMGQQVVSGKLKAGTNQLSQSKLASGIYFVHITVDGKTTLKRMEIRH